MQWYWWILIVAALVGFIFLKIKIGGNWMKKRKEKQEQRRARLEDDE